MVHLFESILIYDDYILLSLYNKIGILMNSASKPYVYNPSGITLELDYIADTIFHSAPPTIVDGKPSSMFTFRIYGGGSSNIQTMQYRYMYINT